MSSFSPSLARSSGSSVALPPTAADGVVGLLQPALGAGGQHAVGAEPGQLERGGGADPARGAGDEGDAAGQRPRCGRGHQPARSSDSWRSVFAWVSVSGMA